MGGARLLFHTQFSTKMARVFSQMLKVHAWDDVGHYVIEDAPERVIEQMQKMLQGHRK